MTSIQTPESPFPVGYTLPDHTQLPDSDGAIVQNFQEHPQSILLTDSIQSVLPLDGQYAIGQDCGIYWRLTDPPLRGSVAPDWFFVPNVPPTLNGQFRRSYVLWLEYVSPTIVLEFVSGNGSEERDKTPTIGKFWVYEQGIRVPFYGIYEVNPGRVEMYHLIEGVYQLMQPNDRGHYPIPPLGVEIGIWQGCYQNVELPWMRWWDEQGNLLLTGWELNQLSESRAESAESRAESAESRAESAESRADRLAERLKSLGIDPEDL